MIQVHTNLFVGSETHVKLCNGEEVFSSLRLLRILRHHAIYGIFRSGLKYEGAKLFPRITLS